MNPLKIIFFASIFILAATNINDPDAFTQLSIGREIIKNHGFPVKEPFVYTQPDAGFGHSEWLFSVVIYAIYVLTAPPGVVLFKAGIITLTYLVLFKDSMAQPRAEGLESRVKDPRLATHGTQMLLAVIILFFVALFARERFVERPEIISNLFLVFTIFSLNQFLYCNRRYIYLLPFIFILWANMHPSIITGLYAFAAFIIGSFIQTKIFSRDYAQGLEKIKTIAIVLSASIIAALFNPDTYHIFIAPKGLASDIWRYEVVELMPPSLHGHKFLYIFIAILFLSFLFNLRNSIINIIIIAPFVALSLNAVRFIALMGMVGAPVIARNISNLKFQISDLRLKIFKMFASVSIIIITFLTIINIGPFKIYARQFGISIDESSYPKDALDYLNKNNIYGRIFNTFHYGGYITFKEHPKRLTFIDGRGGIALKDYLDARGGETNWQRVEEKYGVNIAVLMYPPAPSLMVDMDIDAALPYKGWTLVYWDAASLVYLKDDEFKDIVKRDGYRYIKPANGPGQFEKRLHGKWYVKGVMEELNRNISANPNPWAYILLGFAYNEISEFNKAVETLNKVFEYKRMVHLFPLAHNGLGFSYTMTNNMEKALYHFKKSRGYLEDPDILFNMAVVYFKTNDYKNAIYYLKRAIAVKDNFIPAYINLIDIYSRLGDKEKLSEIESLYRRKLDAVQGEAHFNTALKLYIDGKLDEALLEFKKSLEANPYSPAVYANIGFIYYDKDEMDEAKVFFIRAIEIEKNWADAHYGLALVYKKLGDKVNAKAGFEEYLKASPRGFWARRARDEILKLTIE